MLRLIASAVVATGIALPVAAQDWDHCQDLWFTRNQLFDRAGYCFKTPLGKAVFDNSNCTTSEAQLSPTDWQKVEIIRSFERDLGCAIDTTNGVLSIPLIGLRFELEDVPIISEFASGCLGWNGPSVPLYAGHRPGAPLFGFDNPGDDIVWEYEYPGMPAGWEFITVYRDGVQVMLGWSNTPIDYGLCTNLAG